MSVQAAYERAGELVALVGERGFGGLADAELVGALTLLGEVVRLCGSVGVEAAIEVGNRTVMPVGQSMPKAFGAKNTADVLAEFVGISLPEARTWSRVATAVESELSLTGEVLPPRFPAVADAVDSGAIAPATAEVIVQAVDEVRPFLSLHKSLDLERSLVAQAPGFSRRDFLRLCREVPERILPESVEFREALQYQRRGVHIGRGTDGSQRMVVTGHPEGEGFIVTALDARTAPRRQPTFGDGPDDSERDERTLSQRRYDALIDMARESLAHDNGQVAGTAVTMVVTMTLEELRRGIGTAKIAGVDQPVSAATARRLAADAEIIPCVLGGPSEILDQGRAFRLFTDAQRRAIAVRDGGCVWPGCAQPPGWCEVAHLTSWLDGGPTDLANGVLLCPFHHRCFDHDDWQMEWRAGVLWLLPPPHVDATRRPRRAGRRELVI
ncbi:MAG: hypothetical protein JWP32_689 [Schumannella sp.]|nr:hypothetical protein [Schumannella sp.]